MTNAATTPRVQAGRRGEVLFESTAQGLGCITIAVLDPVADLGTIHEWVTRPSARFWGLGDHTRAELGEVYEYVDTLPSHHAYLVRRDGLPVVLLQTYEPENDPLGEFYPAEPGDLGVHFFLGARGPATPAFTTRIGAALFDFLFTPASVDRLVVEPDAANRPAVDRMLRFGFDPGPEIALPTKCAQLAFLTRAAWPQRVGTFPPMRPLLGTELPTPKHPPRTREKP